jgi:hypothetical protein
MPITPYPDHDGPRYVTEADAHPVPAYRKSWTPAGIDPVPVERTKRRGSLLRRMGLGKAQTLSEKIKHALSTKG